MAEFLRRGVLWVGERAEFAGPVLPDGWTRMTLPSLASWTDPATIETSMAWRAQRRPTW